mgnify:CR=1 FL=1
MSDEYSIEQRHQLASLLLALKKDINAVIDGLLTNNSQDHEVMLLCEQFLAFPESTYIIRKLTLENITLNTMPICTGETK